MLITVRAAYKYHKNNASGSQARLRIVIQIPTTPAKLIAVRISMENLRCEDDRADATEGRRTTSSEIQQYGEVRTATIMTSIPSCLQSQLERLRQ